MGMRMLNRGELNILVQMTTVKSPEIVNVPGVMEFAKTDEQWQVLELPARRAGYGLADVRAAGGDRGARSLRRAYLAMLEDPETLADAKRFGIDIAPVTGEDIHTLLKRVYATRRPSSTRCASSPAGAHPFRELSGRRSPDAPSNAAGSPLRGNCLSEMDRTGSLRA